MKTIKNKLNKKLRIYRTDLKNTIDIAKQEGKEMVEKSIGESKNKSFTESDKIISEAKNKSKSVSLQLDRQMTKEIMDIIFSGM